MRLCSDCSHRSTRASESCVSSLQTPDPSIISPPNTFPSAHLAAQTLPLTFGYLWTFLRRFAWTWTCSGYILLVTLTTTVERRLKRSYFLGARAIAQLLYVHHEDMRSIRPKTACTGLVFIAHTCALSLGHPINGYIWRHSCDFTLDPSLLDPIFLS
jgi:hypothetical protein